MMITIFYHKDNDIIFMKIILVGLYDKDNDNIS